MQTEELKDTIAPLPFPVTFVCRSKVSRERWSDLFLASDSIESIPDPDTIPGKIVSNEDCWIVLTYLHLKRRNLNVYLSDRFVPGTICVASAIDFGIRDKTFDTFVVGCRSDGFKPALCDVAIVQNPTNVQSKTDILIPHWPQPGLIERNQARVNYIENLVFKGSDNNLYQAFRSEEFIRELENLGVRFQINGLQKNRPVEWHDYSEADLVLAVRDLTQKDALVKPASKLVNAWIAGVPALLGPEPAFQKLIQSHLDYIEVMTPKAALDAIRKLKHDPNLYRAMIVNGQKRAEGFSTAQIAQKWQQALAEPIALLYSRWCQRLSISKISGFALRTVSQKIAQAQANYHRTHGYRAVSNRHT
jgi:hypothetical protein